MPILTHHAATRAAQRIAGITSRDDVHTLLDIPAVRAAIAFGAPFVRLATGQRLVIRGGAIITVLPSNTWIGTLDRRREHA